MPPPSTRTHHLLGALLATVILAIGQLFAGAPSAGASGEEPKSESKKTPVARHVDLSKPVAPEPPGAPKAADAQTPAAALEPGADPAARAGGAAPDGLAGEPLDEGPAPFVLLGEAVAPGTSVRLSWSPDQSFEGIAVPTAVLVVNGAEDGPTLCLTAAIHGDELNGIEIVRRVLYGLDPDELSGTVIGVPIVNLQGFRRASRYLPDRRDLNRFFPGAENGSSASRIAHSFFTEVIQYCDALVDVHTGSFARTNLPQLRADMKNPEVARLTQGFGATSVLYNPGAVGTLRRAATDAGIPAVTIETGEPARLQETKIAHGTRGVETLLDHLGMHKTVSIWGEPEPVYYQSTWVRADRGGLLFGDVDLGQRVRKGEVLGTVTDPITNLRSELRSPEDGRVLGMALNQVVMPGFAAFRIGIPTTDAELANPESLTEPIVPADEEEIGETGDGGPEVEEENS
jgi:predicted deacylase